MMESLVPQQPPDKATLYRVVGVLKQLAECSGAADAETLRAAVGVIEAACGRQTLADRVERK